LSWLVSAGLAPDDESHTDLICVVDNELVAPHASMRVVFDGAKRHLDISLEPLALRRVGPASAHGVRAVAASG